MSIQEVSSVPNVYKLEKFIIIDTEDTFGVAPLEVTKPNLLHCRKVYISVDVEGTKREHIDIHTMYYVAVPLSLWQQGSFAGLDNGGNSLICPPYVATNTELLRGDETLAEHITHSNVHRGSLIYAQRRDYGADIYGDDGNNLSRQGKASDEIIARYVDVNADGRSLKISSIDHPNSVDLSANQFTQRHGGTGDLTNYYDRTASNSSNIEALQKACIINEDGAIEYLTDIEKVNTAGLWDLASAPDTSKTYGLVFSAADSNSKYPVLKFKESAAASGTNTKFTGLTDAPDQYKEEDRHKLVNVNGVAKESPAAGALEFNHLHSWHLRGNESSDHVEGVNTVDPPSADSPYFAVTKYDESDDSKYSSVVLKKFHELVDSGYAKDTMEATGDFQDQWILVADGDEPTASKFRRLHYIDQLKEVVVDGSILTKIQGTDNPQQTAFVKVDIGSNGVNPKITFAPLGDLLDKTGAVDTLQDLSAWYVVQSGGEGGLLKAAPLSADLFDGLGGGGDSTVRYVKGTRTLQLKDEGFGTKEGGDVDKSLNYTPTLFGICKEDGSYEYRYFLTSAAVTAT
jgi:hypothetical protein